MAGLGSRSICLPVAFAIALSFAPSVAAQPVIEQEDAVNGARLRPSDNASAQRHQLGVGAGIVRIEITLLTPVPPGSFWELDFSSSERLIAGSLKAEGGVAASDGRRIVFRLSGDRGETFRPSLSVR
ncbi:MAG TPA: hypothetical protein VIE88_10815 [Vicinamibacteria bacterium]|jgi:hypothetical protein